MYEFYVTDNSENWHAPILQDLSLRIFRTVPARPGWRRWSDLRHMALFPGLADAGSCSDWETGIPIDLDKIRDKDEKYWDDFNGTPKALISIQSGLNLWQNKYGSYTSIRFSKNDISTDDLKTKILNKLNPEDLNLSFLPI